MIDLKDYFDRDPFIRLLGASITEIGEGSAKAQLVVEQKHLNAYGVCHGAVLYSLCDIAFAVAVNSHGVATLTTGANINYISPAHEGDRLYAEAHELVNHHRMPFAEVRITNQDQQLVAVFTAGGYRKAPLTEK